VSNIISSFCKGINWKIRIKSKQFWFALIPALFLTLQAFLAIFGLDFNFGQITERILHFVDVLFALLTIMGVVVDPTTKGISDSEKARGYDEVH
jgi:phi LC3 family holin